MTNEERQKYIESLPADVLKTMLMLHYEMALVCLELLIKKLETNHE